MVKPAVGWLRSAKRSPAFSAGPRLATVTVLPDMLCAPLTTRESFVAGVLVVFNRNNADASAVRVRLLLMERVPILVEPGASRAPLCTVTTPAIAPRPPKVPAATVTDPPAASEPFTSTVPLLTVVAPE